ncbi:MAG: phosphocarrier protein HPr [Pseudohongiellaceae bacterium]|jgi:phosphocarrier protein HPr
MTADFGSSSMPVSRLVVRIVNKQGLHARPISDFVKTVSRFSAVVTVRGPGGEASGSSVLQMMGLAAGLGAELDIRADGGDAEAVLEALSALVANGFGEP